MVIVILESYGNSLRLLPFFVPWLIIGLVFVCPSLHIVKEGEGKQLKTNWGAVIQIAAVYVGTVVGAGFATGREIVEFFSRFGFIGLIGMLMSGYILIFLGFKVNGDICSNKGRIL